VDLAGGINADVNAGGAGVHRRDADGRDGRPDDPTARWFDTTTITGTAGNDILTGATGTLTAQDGTNARGGPDGGQRYRDRRAGERVGGRDADGGQQHRINANLVADFDSGCHRRSGGDGPMPTSAAAAT